MEQIKLSSPWTCYFRAVSALFDQDPDVRVYLDEEALVLTVLVNDDVKANAISKLLPEEKVLGNVTLKIEVKPSNAVETSASLIKSAFNGNPILAEVVEVDTPLADGLTYVLFERAVVQYFNDDLGDLNGIHSTLYEDIARDVFKDLPGTYFCTETIDADLDIPLGEWP